MADVDLWGYLAFGRVFWEGGYFPFQDIFSYTPTKPVWVYHEWLTGVIFYPVLKYAGPAGLQLVRYITILLTLYLVYLTAKKKGGNTIAIFAALIPAAFLISYGYSTVVRAQIFTYLFFMLTIYVIESARKDQKWLILLWLLPIQGLWCNLHGGFVTGLCVIGLYAAGDTLSGKKFLPLVIILFPATLITLINPYGLEYWKFILHAVAMPRPEIDEWMSVFSALKLKYQLVPVTIFIVLSALCFFFFALNIKKSFTEIIILFAISYIGYKHARHVIFMGLLFGAFLPMILSQWLDSMAKKWNVSGLPWIMTALLAAFFITTNWIIHQSRYLPTVPSFNISAPSFYYPLGALKWMQEKNIKGNILPFFGWGEFLIWSCYPDCKVAMDGRYETVYPEEVHKEYFNFLAGRNGWEVFLHKYPHDLILIRKNSRIHNLINSHPGWKNIYDDATSVLLIKRNHPSHPNNK